MTNGPEPTDELYTLLRQECWTLRSQWDQDLRRTLELLVTHAKAARIELAYLRFMVETRCAAEIRSRALRNLKRVCECFDVFRLPWTEQATKTVHSLLTEAKSHDLEYVNALRKEVLGEASPPVTGQILAATKEVDQLLYPR